MKKWKLVRVALAVGILAAFSAAMSEENVLEESPTVTTSGSLSEFQQQFIQTQVTF